uniref:K Homology domain-containing protein n=1 Tax=Alexandrium catenella TaxID=2925 RepID=A0A7S1WEL7_ALECA
MGGDGKGGWKGGGGGQKRKYWESTGRRHAFKILCPESLINGIMGKGGARKDQLQEETYCRLVFSNREEYFPGTRYRVLCIYGDDPGSIGAVLERVIDRIIECGDHEQRGSHWAEGDFTGKETGEYVLRALISVRMSGAVIGTKGSNIQAIRDENRAKIFIEKNILHGHQMMRVIATPDGLRSATARLNECVQTENEGEEFQQWAAVKTFPDEEGSSYGKGKAAGGKGSGKLIWKGGGGGGDHGNAQPHRGGVGGAGQEPRWQEHSGGKGANGFVAPVPPDDIQGILQALSTTVHDYPSGALDLEYTITCEMPSLKVPSLIGESDEHVDSVMEATGTRISFEDTGNSEDGQQTLFVHGPLLRAYRAHALMMKRYHDAAAEEAAAQEAEAEAEAPSVEDMKDQIAQLQKQLAMAQGQTGGKGKGKKA